MAKDKKENLKGPADDVSSVQSSAARPKSHRVTSKEKFGDVAGI